MKGVLLVNLGSPKSPLEEDVRIYLREFLMDKWVIDVPWIIRKAIVETAILPKRPKESAHAYKSVWMERGSPLIVLSERMTDKLKKKVEYPVALAMRYQEPSIKNGLQELSDKGVKEILVIPLYPQYAMSTTVTVIEKVREEQQKYFKNINLKFLNPFYKDEEYIKVLSSRIKSNLQEDFDLLLFSYHGLPERHIYKTEKMNGVAGCKLDSNCCFKKDNSSHEFCYRHQCYSVTEAVRKELGLDKDKVKQTFQSRLGNAPWLQPYTDQTLIELAKTGTKKIAVVAPAFVTDCLETLEEISIQGKESFIENGGERFDYIECLNDYDLWIDWMIHKIKEEL